MQQIISATAGMANQRVNILTNAFSRISTINFKELTSAKDTFIAIGSAAQGLTSLIVSGNEAQLQDFEAKKQAELEAAGGNTKARENIEKKYNKKLVKLKKSQAKEDKRKAIIDASISTFLGVAKALGSSAPPENFIVAGLVAALGGTQIALIGKQQQPEFSSDKVFTEGGVIAEGKSHAQGGINIFGDNGQYFGNVQGNEAMYVLKNDATAEISALSQLNEKHGGRSFGGNANGYYADGGEVAPVDVGKIVSEEIQRTPIFVKVGDIETGMTDVANVKQASVI